MLKWHNLPEPKLESGIIATVMCCQLPERLRVLPFPYTSTCTPCRDPTAGTVSAQWCCQLCPVLCLRYKIIPNYLKQMNTYKVRAIISGTLLLNLTKPDTVLPQYTRWDGSREAMPRVIVINFSKSCTFLLCKVGIILPAQLATLPLRLCFFNSTGPSPTGNIDSGDRERDSGAGIRGGLFFPFWEKASCWTSAQS